VKNLVVFIRRYFTGSTLHKRILYVFLGAAGGYAYYHFIGCSSGACPISSDPWISTFYGMAMGYILAIGKYEKKSDEH